jgi:hypothetical protein
MFVTESVPDLNENDENTREDERDHVPVSEDGNAECGALNQGNNESAKRGKRSAKRGKNGNTGKVGFCCASPNTFI